MEPIHPGNPDVEIRVYDVDVGVHISVRTYGSPPYQPTSPLASENSFFWSSSTLLEKALTATFLGKRLIKKIHIKFLVKLFQSLSVEGKNFV